MATQTSSEGANVGTGSEGVTRGVADEDRRKLGPHLTSDQVWRAVVERSFAVLSHATPSGEPRSSGVVYTTVGRRLYVAVAPGSWKAKHVAACRRVSVTVPVRRGGILSLVLPIPPATVSFHGSALVHRAGSSQAHALLLDLGSLIPDERRDCASIIEIVPEGAFVTYGLGVSLVKMRDPAAASARVSIAEEGETP
jgi:hypothetical protein